jgi:hypothetical protein
VGRRRGIILQASLVGGLLTFIPALANAAGCPNEISRTGLSGQLPDCRAYEQMTPVNKGIAEDMFGATGVGGGAFDVGVPSDDGDRFMIDTTASFGSEGASGENSYVFERGVGGWRTTALAAKGLGVQSLAPEVYDPSDLSQVGISDAVGSGEDHSTLLPTSLVGPPGGPYTTLYSAPPSEEAEMVGASADLSHVVLASTDNQLAPGDAGQDAGSYAVYESVGGSLRLVNVKTDGSLVSQCGAILGQNRGFTGGSHNAVSGDGSKIFFTAPDPFAAGPGCWENGKGVSNPPQLYMRVDGTSTVNLSAPEPGVLDPNGLQPAVYVGASVDGSKVFFLTQTELTADDTTHAPELYEYNAEAPSKPLTRISHGVSGNAEGNVRFVPVISSDGSTVYFTATGQLAPGAPVVNGEQVNLYRYDTNADTTTYVATVGEEDYPSNFAQHWYGAAYQQEVGLAVGADWYTTPDGRFLVFATKQNVTSYDSTAASGVICEGYNGGANNGHCSEVYRYDAATGGIACVSCDPGGAAPVSNARFARSSLRTKNPAGTPPRPISENGEYVFFDSADSLVPQAGAGVIRVYEWHDGAVSLISSGSDPANSLFLGMGADGGDVFFGTHAELVAQDTDVAGDLYDARIDGGFGQITPPVCTGSGCQGVPGAPPIFATPSSATFEGVGNFAPLSPGAAGTKLTRAQKLAKARKACRAKRNMRKRRVCESSASKKYAAAANAKQTNRRGN